MSCLFVSPAEELHFGTKEGGERKCTIVLNNVTKNTVAFKVKKKMLLLCTSVNI